MLRRLSGLGGRSVIVGALMFLAVALTVAITPTRKIADVTPTNLDLNALVPMQFGDWKVDESVVPINPSPDQARTLNQTYSQMVNRSYLNSRGERMMLSIAYGTAQTREVRAHRQEVCYGAQGFQINGLHDVTLIMLGRKIQATRMHAVSGPRSEPVTYWFTMGDEIVRSYLDRQLVLIKFALSGYIPDGYLFRVSSISTVVDDAYRKQSEFSEVLLSNIKSPLQEKLTGLAPASH